MATKDGDKLVRQWNEKLEHKAKMAAFALIMAVTYPYIPTVYEHSQN